MRGPRQGAGWPLCVRKCGCLLARMPVLWPLEPPRPSQAPKPCCTPPPPDLPTHACPPTPAYRPPPPGVRHLPENPGTPLRPGFQPPAVHPLVSIPICCAPLPTPTPTGVRHLRGHLTVLLLHAHRGPLQGVRHKGRQRVPHRWVGGFSFLLFLGVCVWGGRAGTGGWQTVPHARVHARR